MLERATIFCVPSRTARTGDSEGLGIVFLEAQAMGVPVVSSFHGGVSEAVIHGETGLLSPEGDYRTLADHLQLLLRREDLRLLYGERGIQWVREAFDIEMQTSGLEDIYEEVLAQRATGQVIFRDSQPRFVISGPICHQEPVQGGLASACSEHLRSSVT